MNWNDNALDSLDLTDKQREVLEMLREGKSQKGIAEELGKSFGTITDHVKYIRKKANIGSESKAQAKPESASIQDKITDLSRDYQRFLKQRRFTMIVTSAQNDTPVHERFFNNLLCACETMGAKLLAIPFRYKNPTSTFVERPHDYWDEKVRPYLCEDDFEVNANLMILGRLKTQPTAVRPLSGLETASGDSSAIIGHAKIQLRSIATQNNRLPKTMVTTGACTIENYTDSKAGYKGEARHTLGAALIEVDGDKFFLRQLVADARGDFIDLDTEYCMGVAYQAPRPSLLATGDLHGVQHDPAAVNATFFAHNSMAKFFRPKAITIDDSLDFQSASHHNRRDPVVMHRLSSKGLDSVERELKATYELIDRIAEETAAEVVIKRSNHDEHFDRWVKETDPRKDVINGLLWCEAFPVMVDGRDPYEYFASKWMRNYDSVRFLKRDESYTVDGVSHDGHGDMGANGSRGGLIQFTRLGSPAQWGHSHSPGIEDDQYQHGTLSLLRLGYNKGPSSWQHCNTIQYANGKRSHLFIIDGRWRF